LPLGIVSIVYASKVEGYVIAGDIEKAKENSKKAAMWAWISFGVGIIIIIISFLAEFFAAGSLDAFSEEF